MNQNDLREDIKKTPSEKIHNLNIANLYQFMFDNSKN